MLLELASSYLKAINSGKLPTIENAWDYVQQAEVDRAVKESIKEMKSKFEVTLAKELPLGEEDLKKRQREIKDSCMEKLQEGVIGQLKGGKMEECTEKMRKEFKQLVKEMEKKNQSLLKDGVIQILD